LNVLQRATPESQGMTSSAVLQFVEALDTQVNEIHSFMLVRHGAVIAEGWWSPYRPESPHVIFSLSKSFTSTAVGLAVNEGLLSIDDPVLPFFPDDAPAEVNDHLKAMRVRHLLSMSTGQVIDTWRPMIMREDANWSKGFFEVPVLHEPGTYFLYNTGATYMLSAIVQKVTGMKLIDYLRPRLFEPLGIENPKWDESPLGVSLGGIGLHIRTEDIARFGQLYLQKGMWQGKRLIPEAWVEEATSFQVANGEDPENDWAQGYGYQFWRCRHGAYRGDGAFGQYCVVMPEQDAVVAITGGLSDMQQPLNLIWNILLPAMGGEPCAEDPATLQRLNEKLSNLALLPLQGRAESPISSQVSGRLYRFEDNDFDLETLSLTFTPSGGSVTLKTEAFENTFPFGNGTWQPGETRLFNEPWVVEPAQIVTSGVWTADDRFTMIVRRHETPFFNTVDFHFSGDELIVESQINVTFETKKTLMLTARAV
jgi:CubicO group peptidase (beta-lactamase class C family)